MKNGHKGFFVCPSGIKMPAMIHGHIDAAGKQRIAHRLSGSLAEKR